MVVGPFRMMARDDNRFEVLTSANRVTLMFENIALGNKREIYLGRTEHSTKAIRHILATRSAASKATRSSSIRRASTTRRGSTTRGRRTARRCTWSSDPARAGGKYLEYQVTADDPKALAKPYTYTRYYQRSNRAAGRLLRRSRRDPLTPVSR